MGACVVTLQWVNVCCMMNEIFTHLHVLHLSCAAQGFRCIFRIGGVSGAGGHGCRCLTVTQSEQAASSFQHQPYGDSLAQPKWARFHCRSSFNRVRWNVLWNVCLKAAAIISSLKSFTVETWSQTTWLGPVRASHKAKAPVSSFQIRQKRKAV